MKSNRGARGGRRESTTTKNTKTRKHEEERGRPLDRRFAAPRRALSLRSQRALRCSSSPAAELGVYARQGADDRVAEHRDVVRLARRDEVAVLDDRLVHVQPAGVLDVNR